MSTEVESARMRLREVTTTGGERFVRSFDRSRSSLQRVTGQSAAQMNRLVRDLRGEIAARMAVFTGGPTDPFTVALIPGLTAEISVALDEFVRVAGSEITEGLGAGFELGGSASAQALRAAGVPVAFPSVSADLLASAAAASENVLSEIVSDLGGRISTQFQRSALGLESTSAAIRGVTDLISGSREVRRGVRRRIGFGFQAEAIVRTEVGRIYSNAQQAASEQISETIPDLRKRWVTTLRKRRGHREAEDRYAPGGDVGPILVKQKFRVTDFSRVDRNVQGFWTVGGRIQPPKGQVAGLRVFKGESRARRGKAITDRMLFPRDPSASVGNIVNCSCVILDVLPEIERAADRALGILQRGE